MIELNDKRTEQIENEAAIWILKMDSEDETLLTQSIAFQNWLKQSEEHQQIYYDLKDMWGELDHVGPDLSIIENSKTNADNDNLLLLCQKQQTQSKKQSFGFFEKNPIFKVVAVVCFMVLAAFQQEYFINYLADEATQTGERRLIILSDGSRLHLNSDSAVNIEFSSKARNITLLKGEASFFVHKDPSRPFNVYTDDGRATALGTIYTVRKHGDYSVVSVIENKVKVSSGGNNVTLKPSFQVVMKDHQISLPKEINLTHAAAWHRGKIIFEDTPLRHVIDELNRHYNGYIHLSDKGIQDLKVNGVFTLGDPMISIELLEKSLGLKSSRFTNRLIILHK